MNDRAWEGYRLLIESSGNCHVVGVHELVRVLMGKERAGVRIVEELERELAKHNIGHLPPRIPRDHKAQVLLYLQDRGGLGFVLHLVHQLVEGEAPSGITTDDQVRMLAMLLNTYRPASQEAEPA
ncbi:hypothetical protein ACFZC6_08375 [Streptomyces ossamyceticus]|uniref:hypothetical protein n=1 Tax=Streptomyces ossamyceticus TaxID=249581 RepID=UPI0036F056C7